MIALADGDTRAAIDIEHGFACASLEVGGWHVLGSSGARVEFPWVGARAARPARLRLGGVAVGLGGGPAEGLTHREWALEVGESEIQPERGSVRARLQTDPTNTPYPFQVELVATWRLDSEGLRLDLALDNRSKSHAPFGIGVRVHLAPVGEPVQALAPAEAYWRRDAQGGLLQGDAPEPVGGGLDLRRPATVTRRIDAQLTRRHFANHQTQLAVLCPTSGREVWLNTSAEFREAELSIEPDGSGVLDSMTCVPDAPALHAAGVPTGLRVLAPGEDWRGSAVIVARAGVH